MVKKGLSFILSSISLFLITSCGNEISTVSPVEEISILSDESSPQKDPNFSTFFSNTYDGDSNIAQNFPDNPDKRFVRFVNETKKKLDICIFEIDNDNITEAIINAHKRGVRVRMVVDYDTTEKSNAVKRLRSAGVPVVDDGGRVAYMHNKFSIQDESVVWTGSYNLTNSASWKHNDNVIKINSKAMAENYISEFEEMFIDKKFGRTSPNNIKRRTIHVSKDKYVTTMFSPEDKVMDAIIKEVSKAKKEIKFMGFSFTDSELANEIVKKAEKGIKVQGIFEYLGSNSNSSAFGKMENPNNPNLNLYVKKPLQAKSLMHHKVFIIDDKVTITGSFNFSKNAALENDENILIIQSQSVAVDYSKEFEKVKARSFK